MYHYPNRKQDSAHFQNDQQTDVEATSKVMESSALQFEGCCIPITFDSLFYRSYLCIFQEQGIPYRTAICLVKFGLLLDLHNE